MRIEAHIDELLDAPPAALTRGKAAVALRVWGNLRARLTRFLDLPGLERVTQLELAAEHDSPGRLGDADVRRLTKCTRMALLDELSLAEHLVTDKAMESIAGSNWRLRRLNVSHTRVGDRGIAALAASPIMDSLEHLECESAGVQDEGVLALAHASRGALQSLLLASSWVSADALDALFSSQRMKALTSFDFSWPGPGAPFLEAMLGARALPRLTHLSLGTMDFDDAAAEAIAVGASSRTLRAIDLVGCTLTPALVAAFGRLPRLERLELYHCVFDDDSLAGFDRGFSHLKTLKLHDCGVPVERVARHPKLQSITEIVEKDRRVFPIVKTKNVNEALDRAFEELNDSGIVALHEAGNESSDGWVMANDLARTQTPKPRGATFYHRQERDKAKRGKGLQLIFGAYEKNRAKKEAADRALADDIRSVLARHGIETVWNGDTDRCIEIPPFTWCEKRPRVILFAMGWAEKRFARSKLPPSFAGMTCYLLRSEQGGRSKLFERLPEKPIPPSLANAGMKLVNSLAETRLADPLFEGKKSANIESGFHPDATREQVRRSFEKDGFEVREVETTDTADGG